MATYQGVVSVGITFNNNTQQQQQVQKSVNSSGGVRKLTNDYTGQESYRQPVKQGGK